MLQRYLYITGILTSLLLLPACVKEDLSKISDSYQWKPSISLPLRSINFTADDFQVPPSELGINSIPVFSKSINFEFSEIYTESGYVDSLLFRMDIKNTFPAQIKVAAYYMDAAGSIIKNIPPLTLLKPEIDESGSVTQIVNQLYDHQLTKDDISTLEQNKSILIRILIEDLELKPEVLNKSDEWNIEISIGLRSTLNIPIDKI